MTHQEVAERLKNIIIDVKIAESEGSEELNIAEIQLETKTVELGISSISFIKIIVMIETEFDIEFDDDDLYLGNEELATIGAFVSYIQEKMVAA